MFAQAIDSVDPALHLEFPAPEGILIARKMAYCCQCYLRHHTQISAEISSKLLPWLWYLASDACGSYDISLAFRRDSLNNVLHHMLVKYDRAKSSWFIRVGHAGLANVFGASRHGMTTKRSARFIVVTWICLAGNDIDSR